MVKKAIAAPVPVSQKDSRKKLTNGLGNTGSGPAPAKKDPGENHERRGKIKGETLEGNGRRSGGYR